MRKLFIEKTPKTPKINFDPENWIFEMNGISRPENVREFYYPIIERLEEFNKIESKTIPEKTKNTPFVVKLYLDYFNSSSAKFILDIILQLSDLNNNGLNPIIEWYYEEDDVDMKEAGEEFEDLIDIEFKYIEIKDD